MTSLVQVRVGRPRWLPATYIARAEGGRCRVVKHLGPIDPNEYALEVN
jgi:hypothetical protein